MLVILAFLLISCDDQSDNSTQSRTDTQVINPQKLLDRSEGEVTKEEPMTPDTVTRL